MNGATILILLVQVAILLAIKRSTHNIKKEIQLNQAELAQALADLGAQLNKALDEIIAAIQNAGNVTPEVEAALNNARAVAQALDDLNPDVPPPPP